MYGSDTSSSLCRKTAAFDLPLKRKRDKTWKIESGKLVFTCFTSDFLLKDADPWRAECWKMMKIRKDLLFYFFTKRIDRFMECAPEDWGEGYDNVLVGCTVENQQMAELMADMGVTHLQGYHFSKPVSMKDFVNDYAKE